MASIVAVILAALLRSSAIRFSSLAAAVSSTVFCTSPFHDGGRDMLAPANRRSENVSVEAVVVPELKLCNVQRHIFATHFVETANNTALENAPEAFNRVGVNGTDNVA